MSFAQDFDGYVRFRSAILAVLDQRYYPAEWLDQRVAEERAIVMCSQGACIAAELRLYPGGALDVHGLVAAGELDEIVNELIPRAEAWGKANGCQSAVIESRPGWTKVLQSSGYQLSQVNLRKEL